MTVNVPFKKYLEIQNGLECANDVEERHLERLMDIKLMNTIRERERRRSKPKFVVNPYDQRDFQKIQIQYVEAAANNDIKTRPNLDKKDFRRSLDDENSPISVVKNKIKVFDGERKPSGMTSFGNELDYQRKTAPDIISS